LNTLTDQAHRATVAGRFDAEAARLLAGGTDRPALGGSHRRSAGAPDPALTRTREPLPCQIQDPDLWFADTPGELEHAKALCQECPAQLACLTGALERREPTGVWGGQILDKGQIVSHKRPRGRPRKGSAIPQRDPQQVPAAVWCPPRDDGDPLDVEGAA
jgi:WhiB family redox-sensing transcriptional regulator